VVGLLQRTFSRLGHLDDVAAAVGGIAPALDVAALLEAVEEDHAVIGIEHQLLAEIRLGRLPLVLQVLERYVLLQAKAEDVLGGPAVGALRDPHQKRDQPGAGLFRSALGFLGRGCRSSCHTYRS
jgi:hypothetical protein